MTKYRCYVDGENCECTLENIEQGKCVRDGYLSTSVDDIIEAEYTLLGEDGDMDIYR